jgi:hypothetical protein
MNAHRLILALPCTHNRCFVKRHDAHQPVPQGSHGRVRGAECLRINFSEIGDGRRCYFMKTSRTVPGAKNPALGPGAGKHFLQTHFCIVSQILSAGYVIWRTISIDVVVRARHKRVRKERKGKLFRFETFPCHFIGWYWATCQVRRKTKTHDLLRSGFLGTRKWWHIKMVAIN